MPLQRTPAMPIDSLPARFTRHIFACTIALASLTACTGSFGTMPVEAGSVVQSERATLAPGQSVTFGADSALRITFREVEQDSRCPVDAQCVWSGDAALLFRIELDGTPIGHTTLHTHLQPQRIVINDDFAIRLVGLSPGNRVNVPVPMEAYRVTIEVSAPN